MTVTEMEHKELKLMKEQTRKLCENINIVDNDIWFIDTICVSIQAHAHLMIHFI